MTAKRLTTFNSRWFWGIQLRSETLFCSSSTSSPLKQWHSIAVCQIKSWLNEIIWFYKELRHHRAYVIKWHKNAVTTKRSESPAAPFESYSARIWKLPCSRNIQILPLRFGREKKHNQKTNPRTKYIRPERLRDHLFVLWQQWPIYLFNRITLHDFRRPEWWRVCLVFTRQPME